MAEPASFVSSHREIELFQDMHHPHLVACYGILEEEEHGGAVIRSIVTERCTMSLRAFLDDHDRWEYFHDERLKRTILTCGNTRYSTT